jgi:mannose-6-phosphate isomerase
MTIARIEPQFVERVWGSFHLEPWFPNPAVKTGEVWFPAGRILIKFLFTTEALSVQVHPDDAYARRHHHHSAVGKTEMWYILSAAPGARIAAGFVRPVTREQVRDAALDGSIEQLLGWFDAHAGATYFTRAGVVHALGAGLVVCEIQQTSDITYRLYDYGRLPARELHLDRAVEVSALVPHPGRETVTALAGGGGERLAACEYFVTERWRVDAQCQWERDSVLIFLEGAGELAGQAVKPGEVWRVPAGTALIPPPDSAAAMTLLRVYEP